MKIRIRFFRLEIQALKIFIFGIFFFLFSFAYFVQTSLASIIKKIEIQGTQNTDNQIIYNHVKKFLYRDITKEEINSTMKIIFSIGLFSDVKIYQNNSSLIVKVSELDLIDKIIFKGNETVDKDILENIISLKRYEPLNPYKIKFDLEIIRHYYHSFGRDFVNVEFKKIKLKNNHVNIIFNINENQKSKIRRVSFQGNNNFSNHLLSSIISTKSSDIFSWITNNDIYEENRIHDDVETLNNFYTSHGYADFQVTSIKVIFDESSKRYEVIFLVDEGKIYNFGKINIESQISNLDVKSLKFFIKSIQGNIYNPIMIENSVEIINKEIFNQGLSFIKIVPITNHNFSDNTISVTYKIVKDNHFFIEKIEIYGNKKTRDYVILQELEFAEGDPFSEASIKRSRIHLQELDMFENVEINVFLGSSDNQVIIEINLIEKKTGEISFSGGYTTGGEVPGFSFETIFSDKDIFGTGHSFRFSFGAGESKFKDYLISFTDPYFLGSQISSGIDIFQRSYVVSDKYFFKQKGKSLKFNIPLNNYLFLNLSYNYFQEIYTSDQECIKDFVESRCSDVSLVMLDSVFKPWIRSSVNYGFTYNTIDNVQNPHKGFYWRVSQEYAGLGGDARFLKNTGKVTIYNTLSEYHDIVSVFTLGGGYIYETPNNNRLRIFDLFKKDSDFIRGFKFNSIGPVEKFGEKKLFLGGKNFIYSSFEVQFPIPIIPDSFGIKGVAFFDGGMIYGKSNYYKKELREVNIIDKKTWRFSTGVGFIWNSPFGPLRFDYAIPLKKSDNDVIQNFNFGISTKF